MARHLISGTFRAISDRIPFGRPVPPTEWLAPDPRDAQVFADAPFPGGRPSEAGDPLDAAAASDPQRGPGGTGSGAAPGQAAAAAVPSPAGPTANAEAAPAAPAPAGGTPPEHAADEATADETTAAKRAPAKRAAAKRAPAKRAPAKRAPVKRAPAKRASADGAGVAAGPVDVAADAGTPATAGPEAGLRGAPTGAESQVAAVASDHPVDPHLTSTSSGAAGALPVRQGEQPWTDEEVEEVTTELREKRERLLEEISYADAQLAEMLRDAGDNAVDDQADAGTRTFEREQEISLAAGTAEKLAQVDRALRRLADGSYGLCENCGQPIGKLRLQAFPRATLCLACKTQQERR